MRSSRWAMLALGVAALAGVATNSFAQGGAGGGGGGGGTTTSGADLQISGSASTGSPDPGSVYTYTFQIKNNGGSTADAVQFEDVLPGQVVASYSSANSGQYTCANFGTGLDGSEGTAVRCSIGSLAKGGQVTVVVGVTAPDNALSYGNTATVSSATADPKTTNNSAVVNVTVKAPTGGLCKGGICDSTSSDVPPVPCATFVSVSAPVGYYSTWAAVWNTFTVQSCSNGTLNYTVEVVETDSADGSVDYDVIYPLTLAGGANQGLVLDNDFAPFNTTYDITYTLRDSNNNVLATSSTRATTPPPQG